MTLRGRHAPLEGEEDQVGAAADTEFAEKIRDVEFYGALGDVEFAGDLFIREIFEERIENFLFATAEIGDGIGLEAAALTGEDRVHKTGEDGARNPETAIGNQRQRADELLAGFGVSQKTLHAETEELVTIGVRVLLADDDEAGFGVSFEKIGQESAGSGARGMAVDYVNLSDGRLEIAHVGSECRFELLDDDFEMRLRQNALELAQHQRVRREDTNRQFGRCALGSH